MFYTLHRYFRPKIEDALDDQIYGLERKIIDKRNEVAELEVKASKAEIELEALEKQRDSYQEHLNDLKPSTDKVEVFAAEPAAGTYTARI